MQFGRILGVLTLCWGLIANAAAVVAQGGCTERGEIVALARLILAERVTLGRFEKRRFGAEAAYMLIHYYGLDDTDASALLTGLMAESITDMDQLNATLTLSRHGIDAGLQVLDPDPVRAFVMAGRSVRRALLLADNGQTYFDLLRRAIDSAGFEPPLTPNAAMGIDLITYVSDQPDDVLLALSDTAEAAGFVAAATILAADMTTLDAYQAIINRHPDDPVLMEQASLPWLQYAGATLRQNTGPVPRRDPSAQAERRGTDQTFYTILRASFVGGQMQFSGIVLNQSGWEAEGEQVALAYLAEVDSGRIDPVRDPEAAWLFNYRAWVALKGREDVQSVLSAFDFPSQRIRHFGGNALTSLDWMLAKEALRPFIQSQSTTMPTRPALLSDSFDWEMWTRAAQAITTGEKDTLFAGGQPLLAIAAELMADNGMIDDALFIATDAFDDLGRLTFLRDVMQRLDRQCDAIMSVPGQAMLLNGDFLFRF